MLGRGPPRERDGDPDPATHPLAHPLSGGDALRRVARRKCTERITAGREGEHGSGPRKAGLRMPVRMALRTGMFDQDQWREQLISWMSAGPQAQPIGRSACRDRTSACARVEPCNRRNQAVGVFRLHRNEAVGADHVIARTP